MKVLISLLIFAETSLFKLNSVVRLVIFSLFFGLIFLWLLLPFSLSLQKIYRIMHCYLTDFNRCGCHPMVSFPSICHLGLDLPLHFNFLLAQLHLCQFNFFV